jgi:HemY protein
MSLDEAETGHIAKIREWSHKKRYAPPDPCWMADGQTFPEWLPFSPLSGRLNALIWTTPPASNLITDHGAMLLSPEDARRDVMADIDERIVPLPPPPDAPLSRKSAIDIDAE